MANNAAKAPQSLYDTLGGESAVQAAVDIFYRKVLSDDSISHFFESTDMDEQRNKQASFLTMALGGPNTYTGKDMRTAHAKLVTQGLNDQHFDAVVHHLGATLTELGVPNEHIQTIAGKLEGLRGDVLGK